VPVEPADDLRPAARPIPGDIPWGYGRNRVTAMAVDPYRAFVYWELTDEAIEGGRAELGVPDAACHLRIHDTTYRVFDGTNANWSMDVAIDRPANNHYVHLGHPGATFHVDVGVRSHDGRFATLARSGPLEMPRDAISPDTRVEWMTVEHGDVAVAGYEHRFTPRPGGGPAPVWLPGDTELDRVTRALVGEGWSRLEWSETEMGPGRFVRWMRWGPVAERWQTHAQGGVRVELVFEGERRVIHAREGTRVVFGPWRVTIQSLTPEGGRRVIDRWAVHYAWLTDAGASRVETGPIIERIVRGVRAARVSGSEARLFEASMASESLYRGASEWRWLGGSERWLQGASETLARGASELMFLGASELASVGASELGRLRASESLWLGASEGLTMGASEWMQRGASEWLHHLPPLAAPARERS
jgi:hypothetical protein